MHDHFGMKGTLKTNGNEFGRLLWLPITDPVYQHRGEHPWEEEEHGWRYHCHDLLAVGLLCIKIYNYHHSRLKLFIKAKGLYIKNVIFRKG